MIKAPQAVGQQNAPRYTDMSPFRAIRREVLKQLGMREMTYGWNLECRCAPLEGDCERGASLAT